MGEELKPPRRCVTAWRGRGRVGSGGRETIGKGMKGGEGIDMERRKKKMSREEQLRKEGRMEARRVDQVMRGKGKICDEQMKVKRERKKREKLNMR